MERNRFHAWRHPSRFLAIGVLNTLAGLSAIYLCKFALGISDIPANMVGYVTGLAVSFWGNATWTFEYRGRRGPRVPRYLAAFMVAYAVNLAALLALKSAAVDSYLAQALSTVPYAATFYVLSRTFVFVR